MKIKLFVCGKPGYEKVLTLQKPVPIKEKFENTNSR